VDEFLKSDQLLSASRKLLADRLKQLRSSSLRAARDREKLPQSLFWSLFRQEIAKLKKQKQKNRLQQNNLYGSDL
jgi:hypothetical protein